MPLTDEERKAVTKDIEDGLNQMLQQLTGWHKALPLAINSLHPHATSTRTLLGINTQIVELGLEIQKALRVGIVLKKEK